VRIIVDLVEVGLSSDLYRTLVKVCMTGRNRGVEMKIDEWGRKKKKILRVRITAEETPWSADIRYPLSSLNIVIYLFGLTFCSENLDSSSPGVWTDNFSGSSKNSFQVYLEQDNTKVSNQRVFISVYLCEIIRPIIGLQNIAIHPTIIQLGDFTIGRASSIGYLDCSHTRRA